jgi:hypothetical protein
MLTALIRVSVNSLIQSTNKAVLEIRVVRVRIRWQNLRAKS